jgi:hypothetical protein
MLPARHTIIVMSHAPIRLGSSADFVELTYLEHGDSTSHDAGAVCLTVSVASHGFHGSEAVIWIDAHEWRDFVHSLQRLESQAPGKAGVWSSEPDIFGLELEIAPQSDLLIVSGRLSRYAFCRPDGISKPSFIQFDFGIDRSLVKAFALTISSLGVPGV